MLRPLHTDAAPENMRDADLGALYRHILETAAERVAAAVELAVTGPARALVHCTAGKDRTGIVVASLLLAARVTPSVVISDYVLTHDNMDLVVERIIKYPPRSGRPINPQWLLTRRRL